LCRVRTHSLMNAIRCSDICSATWSIDIIFDIIKFVLTWLENIMQCDLPLINKLLDWYDFEEELIVIFIGM
jgi:hypothetical protein